MRWRLVLCLAVVVCTVAALVAGYWYMRPRPPIDQASFDKIQIAMTEAEVIEIIGAPPGNYGMGEGELDPWPRGKMPFFDPPPGAPIKLWMGQDFSIEIWLDEQGKVGDKTSHHVRREYESVFDMVCQMLKLKERRLRPPPFVVR
jgi:hypothetical protein